MSSPFEGLVHPPVLRPGDHVPQIEAARRAARTEAAKARLAHLEFVREERRAVRLARQHAKRAALKPQANPNEGRYPRVANPWGLAPGECEVLRLLLLLPTLTDVAAELCTSVKTASTHVARARARMGKEVSIVQCCVAWDRWMRGPRVLE